MSRARRKRSLSRDNTSQHRDFGATIGGGFNEITRAYKRNPTIENYLALRREHPEAEIEVAVIGGIDQLFYMEPELRRHGLHPNLVASALDADPDAISELALLLLEKIVAARKLRKRGRTHLVRRGLAIPDKLIDWIITCSLDGLSWNDTLHIPRDLIVLIRERLGGSMPEYEQASEVHQHKMNAAMVAGQLKAQGIKPSYRLLATVFNVSPSTVKRWFSPGEFETEAARWASMCDTNGRLLPLSALRTKQGAQR